MWRECADVARSLSARTRDERSDVEWKRGVGRSRRLRHAPRRPALGTIPAGMGHTADTAAAELGSSHGGPLADALSRHPASSQDRRHEKTALPRSGDERCQARGTTPLRGRLAQPPSPAQRQSAMRRLANGSRFALLGARRRLLRHASARPLGAELGGLVRRRSRSRFAATAVLWPVPAGYSSSSSLRSLVVSAPYQAPRCASTPVEDETATESPLQALARSLCQPPVQGPAAHVFLRRNLDPAS
jgi:hypothetical protein